MDRKVQNITIPLSPKVFQNNLTINQAYKVEYIMKLKVSELYNKVVGEVICQLK